MDVWGGAQWVMLCYLAFQSLAPVAFRLSGLSMQDRKRRSTSEWIGWYLSNITGLVALVVMLRWGGFY